VRVNVYIRKENEDEWDKIDNKSDWVNERLSTGETTVLAKPVPKVEGVSVGFCPHGYGKGNCKQDDCNRRYR
jgi:hypothetical protein